MKGLRTLLRTAGSGQEHKLQPASAPLHQTISDRLRGNLTERSNAPAIWIAPQQHHSFCEVFDIVGEIAKALRSHVGVPHPRVACAMPRGSAGLFGFLSAIEVGTCCPLDAKLTGSEFAEVLVALQPDVLLTTEPAASAVLEAARAAGIPCVGFRLSPSQRDVSVSVACHETSNDRATLRAPLLLRGGEPPAILLRTSGTTAAPNWLGSVT
jgi:acyl-CoA synthetase (AMP-forming)/AMP-acid ligase II